MLPCGLGARDTLRTEMGYPLHGQDISPRRHPQRGPARLGGRLEEGRVLGPRRAARGEGGRARSGSCAAWSPTGRGIPRPRHDASASPPTSRSARSPPAPSRRPCARASAWRCSRRSSTPRPRSASTSAAAARSSSSTKPPFVDPSVREADVNLPEQPPTFRPPTAGRAAVVVAARGRRRRGGRAVRATSPTSGSPPRPTPSRGSARSGPTSPRRASRGDPVRGRPVGLRPDVAHA